MNIVVIYGTRPEAVKLAPVIGALRQQGAKPFVIATGQHTDLLTDTIDPHVNLRFAGVNDPVRYVETCEQALRGRLSVESRPNVVVVQGDTASALAGARAAQALEIPVAHVEAGVRTGDPKDPWPEEYFRVEIDRISVAHFYATAHNCENAIAERAESGEWRVGTFLTGNPGIDALYQHTSPYDGIPDDRVVVTLHRRESFGKPLQNIIHGICEAAEMHSSLEFWWPMHPNPAVRAALDAVAGERKIPRNVEVIQPRSPIAFAQTLSRARAVITDSGGVQEEAAALGVPCVVARNVTDRPESVELGLAQLAGTNRNLVRETIRSVLDMPRPKPSDCFGDGKAAPRIAEHLLGAIHGA